MTPVARVCLESLGANSQLPVLRGIRITSSGLSGPLAGTSCHRNPEWLGLIRVMTGAIVIQPALVAETMARIGDEEDTLETWLAVASADGRLRVSDPPLTSRTFWAALTGAFLMPAIYGTPLPEAEASARKHGLI